MLVTRTTDRIVAPTAAWRHAADAAPATAHAALFDASGCLDAVELGRPPLAPVAGDRLRVLAWNAERLKHLDASIDLLRRFEPDVLLLTELDRGMARSGNRDTPAELGVALGMAHVFAVEFVELGLGDARERAWQAGEANRDGLHGNAILSRRPIDRAAMSRLDRDGTWFEGERNGERRIGGRNAVLAEIAGITFVAVHLESHSDPGHRAAQTRVLLADLEAFAGTGPAVIGGDFNTAVVAHDAKGTAAPDQLLDPVPHEPLFTVMAAHGFAWESCNTLGVATQRTRPDGTPRPPFGRIDWLFTRGLAATDPATLPATDPSGSALSDHEILAVTIEGLPCAS
jgi:endonuclease/exonuclease/phosphatase family metal-dependent hydrolase